MAISTTSAGVGENAGELDASLGDDEACGDDDDDDDDETCPAAAVCLLPCARCSSLLMHVSDRTHDTYITGTNSLFE